MPNIKYNYYLLIKITNTINGHYFIGAHATNEPRDDYFGSGIRLKKAIQKFGKVNFTKEIIETCDSMQEMLMTEVALIDKIFISRLDTYNDKLPRPNKTRYLRYSEL